MIFSWVPCSAISFRDFCCSIRPGMRFSTVLERLEWFFLLCMWVNRQVQHLIQIWGKPGMKFVSSLQILLCTSNPIDHPFITEREKIFLQKELGQLERSKTQASAPWRSILTSWPVMALVVAGVGSPKAEIKTLWSSFYRFSTLYRRLMLLDWLDCLRTIFCLSYKTIVKSKAVQPIIVPLNFI